MTRANRIKLVVVTAVIAIAPSVGVAYNLSGQRWSGNQVPYYINPNNAWVSSGDAIAAIQTGAAVWSMQSNANVSLYYMGQTSTGGLSMNTRNEVSFRNSNTGVIAEAYYWYDSTNRIREADIVMYEGGNRFFAGSSGCSGGYYIEDVVAHEFGHVLGLRHSDSQAATMYPTTGVCSTSGRYLDWDDIAGIEAIYPPTGGSPSAPPPPPPPPPPPVVPDLVAFTVEATTFAEGGQGCWQGPFYCGGGYYDETPGNWGDAQVRPGTDVDLWYDDGGIVIGGLDGLEWLAFRVNVPQSGQYRVTFRTASPADRPAGSGVINIGIHGVDGSWMGNQHVPVTGGPGEWHSYVSWNSPTTIYLPAGQQTLTMWAAGGWYNVHNMRFTLER